MEVVGRTLRLGVARCGRCGHRPRLLPADLLPRKTYALSVIGQAASLYDEERTTSLRKVVWEEMSGDRTPAPSTLHAWTEGLGAYALGRPAGEVADAVPAARIVSELKGRFPQLRREARAIPPRRAHSQARKERLLAGRGFLRLARGLTTDPARALTHLNRLVLTWSTPFALGFRTGLASTPIEQLPPSIALRSPVTRPATKRRAKPCTIRGRSPPGASNN
ncbi:MAG: hypothetical protein GF355_16030 [Candidatus Eisenbacteria bacterium]|nr:hypothetical protein [Candidatus Eisenbacteria bacterium]